MADRYRSTGWTDASTATLVGFAITGPLGICMAAIMVGALFSMLLEGNPLPFLLYGFPIAALVSWTWAAQQIKSRIVEIEFDGAFVSVRSAWDVGAKRPAPPGSAVIDVRPTSDGLLVTVGLDTHRIRRADFARFDEIGRSFDEARRLHVLTVHDRVDRD